MGVMPINKLLVTMSLPIVISNNLNIVMKVLTVITIVMSVPTMVFSFYGMNVVDLPLPYTWFPVVISVILAVIVAILITKNKFYK